MTITDAPAKGCPINEPHRSHLWISGSTDFRCRGIAPDPFDVPTRAETLEQFEVAGFVAPEAGR